MFFNIDFMDCYVWFSADFLLSSRSASLSIFFTCIQIIAFAIILLGWWFEVRLVTNLMKLNVASSLLVFASLPDNILYCSAECFTKE